ANGLGIEEIARSLGADSLGYISEEGMIAATNQPEEALCTACFSGKYPVTLPEHVARAQGILQARESEPIAAEKDA
ncbi:MAG TPA: amidophosphoribosyltransferase, partial [Brachybacterium faecium]|nr:amidophosphoribosyltransferase [Brachybacterium faecium]